MRIDTRVRALSPRDVSALVAFAEKGTQFDHSTDPINLTITSGYPRRIVTGETINITVSSRTRRRLIQSEEDTTRKRVSDGRVTVMVYDLDPLTKRRVPNCTFEIEFGYDFKTKSIFMPGMGSDPFDKLATVVEHKGKKITVPTQKGLRILYNAVDTIRRAN